MNGTRADGMQGVRGSNPLTSTTTASTTICARTIGNTPNEVSTMSHNMCPLSQKVRHPYLRQTPYLMYEFATCVALWLREHCLITRPGVTISSFVAPRDEFHYFHSLDTLFLGFWTGFQPSIWWLKVVSELCRHFERSARPDSPSAR